MRLLLLLLLLPFSYFGQCAGGQSVTVWPEGPYKGGDTVDICYRLDDWYEEGGSWLNGFRISMSPEWHLIQPIVPPQDAFITSNGNWIWLDQSYNFPEGWAGPGWYYEWVNSQDGNPLNDPGDWSGTIDNYDNGSEWEVCFQAVLGHLCEHRYIYIDITPIGDDPSCPEVPYEIYYGENTINMSACDTYVYIPNTFTPNGDGLNDKIFVQGQAIVNFRWYIYDRWGNLVFETDSPLQSWDGDGYSNGIFTYVVQYSTTNNLWFNRTGHITLLR